MFSNGTSQVKVTFNEDTKASIRHRHSASSVGPFSDENGVMLGRNSLGYHKQIKSVYTAGSNGMTK